MSDIVTTLRTKATEARYWDEGAVVVITLEEANNASAEIERLRKLYDAAWAECESYRRDAYCLNDEGKAHDTARKENGSGNA
jgi:hypothetical protein